MSRELVRIQVIPLPREELFPFFADASNLERITPPELDFRIASPLPVRMEEGAQIDYRLRLLGIPFSWRTRIDYWDPPHRFVDRQLRGPYREWIHEHSFVDHPEGTLMTDRVSYQLPLFPFGEAGAIPVRFMLERIFDYRHKTIEELFGVAP